jgi:transcriptional regulator with XRE-family HTH domain
MSINAPAAPGPLPDGPPHRPAGPGAARDHVRRLHQDGRTYQAIATTAGLAPATVSGLATGRRRPTRGTTTAILAVTSATVPRGRFDAGGTRLRLRALHVMGHGSARIARAVGVHPVTIRKIVRGDARTVSQRLRDAIAELYDAWWDKRAPGRTRFERAAATCARKRAMTGDWCAPAAMDDDRLDISGYRPEYGWKPAAGTGVAPDIYVPVRRHCRRKGA